MLLYKGTTFRAPSYDFLMVLLTKASFRGVQAETLIGLFGHMKSYLAAPSAHPKIGTADLQWKPESWNGTIPMPLGKAEGILALILRNPCSNFLGFAVDVVEHNEIFEIF